jgi:hypothetical protein
MLEYDNPREIVEKLWGELGCRIVLPEEHDEFFGVKGPQSSGNFSAERQFTRFHYRHKALMQHGGVSFAIYTKDISHSSIGFLHFEQLFPLDRVRLHLLNGMKIDTTIRRCLRLRANCFECGGQIQADDRMTPKQLRELFDES